MFKDFREYLSLCEREGKLKRVKTSVKCGWPDTELNALSRYLLNKDIGPVLLDKLEGYNTPEVPVVVNLIGSPERTAMILGTKDFAEAAAKQAQAMNSEWPEPTIVQSGPCKEVIIKEKDIDLRHQVPKVWFAEGQAFITGLVSISHDPETRERNLGWYRYGFFDRHPQTGEWYSEEKQKKCLQGYIYWNPPLSHIGKHFAKAVKKGQTLEVAIVGPCDPTIHAAACTDLPFGKDEFALAGALRGAPVELIQCETLDLQVPATAEWVLEAEVIPGEDELNWGHSHGMGYYDYGYVLPQVRIKCITHRKQPLWYANTEGKPPWDHMYIMFLNQYLLVTLQKIVPEVKALTMPVLGIAVVQLSVDGTDREPEIGKRVMNALWSIPRFPGLYKFVIVVGPDVNPYDINDVSWALWSRCQPIRDSMSQNVTAFLEDPSVPVELQGPQNTKLISEVVGFDALIKVPERYPEFPPVSEPSQDSVAKIEEKLSKELEG
jgi:4-hydroxy-3-polyprenylbenzoate decarboxylase